MGIRGSGGLTPGRRRLGRVLHLAVGAAEFVLRDLGQMGHRQLLRAEIRPGCN